MASNHEIRSLGCGLLSDDQLGLLDMAGGVAAASDREKQGIRCAWRAARLCFQQRFSSTGIKWRRTSPAGRCCMQDGRRRLDKLGRLVGGGGGREAASSREWLREGLSRLLPRSPGCGDAAICSRRMVETPIGRRAVVHRQTNIAVEPAADPLSDDSQLIKRCRNEAQLVFAIATVLDLVDKLCVRSELQKELVRYSENRS